MFRAPVALWRSMCIWVPRCVVWLLFRSLLMFLGWSPYTFFPYEHLNRFVLVEAITRDVFVAPFASLAWYPRFLTCHVVLLQTASLQNLRFPVSLALQCFSTLSAVDRLPVSFWCLYFVLRARIEARYLALRRSYFAWVFFGYLQILPSSPQ